MVLITILSLVVFLFFQESMCMEGMGDSIVSITKKENVQGIFLNQLDFHRFLLNLEEIVEQFVNTAKQSTSLSFAAYAVAGATSTSPHDQNVMASFLKTISEWKRGGGGGDDDPFRRIFQLLSNHYTDLPDNWDVLFYLALLRTRVKGLQDMSPEAFLRLWSNTEEMMEKFSTMEGLKDDFKSVRDLLTDPEVAAQIKPRDILYTKEWSRPVIIMQYLYNSAKKNPGVFLEGAITSANLPEFVTGYVIGEIGGYLTSNDFTEDFQNFTKLVRDFARGNKSND